MPNLVSLENSVLISEEFADKSKQSAETAKSSQEKVISSLETIKRLRQMLILYNDNSIIFRNGVMISLENVQKYENELQMFVKEVESLMEDEKFNAEEAQNKADTLVSLEDQVRYTRVSLLQKAAERVFAGPLKAAKDLNLHTISENIYNSVRMGVPVKGSAKNSNGGYANLEGDSILKVESQAKFENNNALSGGVFFLKDGMEIDFSDAQLVDNTAQEKGGAIYLDKSIGEFDIGKKMTVKGNLANGENNWLHMQASKVKFTMSREDAVADIYGYYRNTKYESNKEANYRDGQVVIIRRV